MGKTYSKRHSIKETRCGQYTDLGGEETPNAPVDLTTDLHMHAVRRDRELGTGNEGGDGVSGGDAITVSAEIELHKRHGFECEGWMEAGSMRT
jgi:hypothetical protein